VVDILTLVLIMGYFGARRATPRALRRAPWHRARRVRRLATQRVLQRAAARSQARQRPRLSQSRESCQV